MCIGDILTGTHTVVVDNGVAASVSVGGVSGTRTLSVQGLAASQLSLSGPASQINANGVLELRSGAGYSLLQAAPTTLTNLGTVRSASTATQPDYAASVTGKVKRFSWD